MSRRPEAAWWRSVCALRRDGRCTLTRVSRETRVPISTLHERLQRWPGLRRATLVLDFAALGAQTAWLLLSGVRRTQVEAVEAFLATHPAVNTVQHLANDADFLVEVVAANVRGVAAVRTRVQALGVESVRVLYVQRDVTREAYLTDPLRYPELTGVASLEAVEVGR